MCAINAYFQPCMKVKRKCANARAKRRQCLSETTRSSSSAQECRGHISSILPFAFWGCEVLSRIGVPGSGRGGSVGRSFRPQKIAPRCARQVGRSGSKSLENGRKRLKRLKKSSRPAPRGQKTKEGRSDGGFRPKKAHVSFSRRASRGGSVGRGRPSRKRKKSQEGVGRSGTPILVLKPRTPFGRVCVSRMVADGYSQY